MVVTTAYILPRPESRSGLLIARLFKSAIENRVTDEKITDEKRSVWLTTPGFPGPGSNGVTLVRTRDELRHAGVAAGSGASMAGGGTAFTFAFGVGVGVGATAPVVAAAALA
jgi:hypothetical protein